MPSLYFKICKITFESRNIQTVITKRKSHPINLGPDIFNSTKCLPVWMPMRKLLRGEGSLNYLREGLRSKGNSKGGGREGRLLSKLILATVSCLLEPGCFWLCLGVMPKCCFGILKGGGLREGTGNSYYGGDIVAGVFS